MRRTALASSVVASVAAGIGFPACSSKAPVHPPALGDCIPTPDAPCGDPSGAVGSGVAPHGDAGGGADTGEQVLDASACGSAATLIATANVQCLPCIEDQANCCMVDLACSIEPGCVALLACAEACAPGDQTCLGSALGSLEPLPAND